MSNSVIIKDLTIGYKKGDRNNSNKDKIVASNINASIERGELTCLLGANGVGKSTLLKTLSAFLPPLSGDIIIEESNIKKISSNALAKRLGVVLTDKCDIKNMSARELVGLGRSPYTGFWGRLTNQDYNIVDRALEIIGISHLRDRMVHTLSDGERQKVMIAKAIAQETPIIFLDEPTAFLDFPSKVEIMQLLHKLTREENKTIFLSTHDMELALQIADKVWLMDKKHGFAIGSPEDLAINGSLKLFFARKGILFDTTTGLFKIENQCIANFKYSGPHGEHFAMLRKGLLRNRINISRDIESNIIVSLNLESPAPFTITTNNMSKSFKTIEELIIEARGLDVSLNLH